MVDVFVVYIGGIVATWISLSFRQLVSMDDLFGPWLARRIMSIHALRSSICENSEEAGSLTRDLGDGLRVESLDLGDGNVWKRVSICLKSDV